MQDITYLVLSFSHKSMDLALREKLAFTDNEIVEFLTKACSDDNIKEAVLLSTCNRVEVYVIVRDSQKAIEYLSLALESAKQVPLSVLQKHAIIKQNQDAVYHIFCVAASLDSLVVGETQITGQLKDAYRLAYENMLCAKDMTRVMHYAFKCAASVRNTIDISSSHTSIAGAAIELLLQKLSIANTELDDKKIAILGTGEIGVLALKHLCKYQVSITLLNRNMQNAIDILHGLQEQIKTKASIEVKPFDCLKDSLQESDVFISATGAPHTVVGKELITPTSKRRIWIDLAVPRDIENVECENLEIYCVDDLQEIITQNKSRRQKHAEQAHKIIESFVQEFFKWLQSLGVEPVIKHIRALAKDSCLKELERAIKKGFVPEEYRTNIEKILHNAFNTFLHNPTQRIKEASESISSDPIIEAVKNIFDIADDIVLLNKYKCEEYDVKN